MSEIILKAENISKQYRLGVVGTGTISHDLNRWWNKIRGKDDPFLKVGAVNDRSSTSNSDYVWALKDINFSVSKGEVLGIIGKNGAGKSTLLKILSKVTSPTTGVIKTNGRIASLLEVGTGFHPELTGRENIYLNGAILGMTKAEIKDKEEEIIDFSGCLGYIDTPVKRYSSGMRVRLAFAVAAHLEPDILVIDEVLAVGDAEFQKKAIGKMQDISKGDGRTVLFVSHNMESIQKLCTRCIVIKEGNILFNGDVNKSINMYLNDGIFIDSKNIFPIIKNGIQIESIKILNIDNKEVSNLILGSKFSFYIELLNHEIAKKINLRLQVFDGQETLITTLNTYHTNNSCTLQKNETKEFLCLIDKLAIAPGEYFLGIQILNLNDMVELYRCDDIRSFSIINGDFYNTGKLPGSKNLGKFITEFEWEINKQNDKS